jgi:predicted transcriptional regulator
MRLTFGPLIERGLADAEAGSVVAVEVLMKEFGVEE